MLNKERLEVIDAMSKRLSGLGVNFEKFGFEGCVFTPQFETWANSEYIEPFKITQAEKGLLMLYVGDGMKLIRRFKNGKLAVSKDGLTYVSLNILDNHYNFINFCESYDIKTILENCEVIENVE